MNNLREKLNRYGQEGLLRFEKELNNEQLESLVYDISSVDLDYMQSVYESTKNVSQGDERADYGCFLPKIDPAEGTDEYIKYYNEGIRAIKNGEVIAVTMAGGQGSRLGFSGPKGEYDIGLTPSKSIFEIICDSLKNTNAKAGTVIPWYIMTSDANDDETRDFFRRNNYFGYPENSVGFFMQGTLPVLSQDGKLLLSEKYKILRAANGNGGIFSSMKSAGILTDSIEKGVKYAFVHNVDNVLVNVCEPVFVGYSALSGVDAVAKTIMKASPTEKAGVYCLKNGKPCIIEYTEVSKEMAEAVNESGDYTYGDVNIGIYIFRLESIAKAVDKGLPYHKAIKKVEHLNEAGEKVTGEKPDCIKFEMFLFDIFDKFDKIAIYRVKRENEFAPVKNKEGEDSPETARRLYINFHNSREKKMNSFNYIRDNDPELASAIEGELKRQQNKIELIASENFVSKTVLAAAGTVLTNKYAEGYPGHRYYGGCEWVDVVEQLAIDRVKKLFGAEFANVQSHSGSSANLSVYFSLLQPGDTIMGMNLAQGGHLTHGSPVNMSGKWFNFVPYGVNRETMTIDYDELRTIAKECRPKLIVAGASAYPRVIDFKKFREVADEVGALLMVDMAHIAGLVAAGEHPNPMPYADVVTSTTHKTLRGPRGGIILTNNEEIAKKINKGIFPGTQGGPLEHIIAAKAAAFKEALSPEFKAYQHQIVLNAKSMADAFTKRGGKLISGGTDNHLLLVDVKSSFGVSGKDAQEMLDDVNITCNKNGIPFDEEKPTITSGIRLGTAAVTTRGMKEEDMVEIADIITLVLKDFEANKEAAKERVAKLLAKYPLYEGIHD